MKQFRFFLLIFGLFLATTGWFLDKAQNFDWFMKHFAPNFVNGMNVLNLLVKGPDNISITCYHPGFRVLLSCWPNLTPRTSVKYIGRSIAYVGFGSEVKNDFQLVAFDENEKKIPPVWEASAARKYLIAEVNQKLLRWGVWIFFLGIGISFIAGLSEFLVKKK